MLRPSRSMPPVVLSLVSRFFLAEHVSWCADSMFPLLAMFYSRNLRRDRASYAARFLEFYVAKRFVRMNSRAYRFSKDFAS